jgi:hypothetical protein
VTAEELRRCAARPTPVRHHHPLGRLVVVVALALVGACSDDGEPVITAGDDPPTEPSDVRSALAIPRCDEFESLSGAPVVDGPLSPDAEVALAQQERAEYGVPSDEASTSAALAAGPSPELGWPMTSEEEAAFMAFNSGAAPTLAQQRYESEPWFAGTWIDNAGRTAVLATTDDVATVQALVDADMGPGVVRVVAAERSTPELDAVRSRVSAWAEEHMDVVVGHGVPTDRNVVDVGLRVLDPAVVADLAAAVGTDGVCVEGTEPADVIPEGPQPERGEGWRLLADEPGAGVPYDTGFAGTAEELAALWNEIGLAGEPPSIDFVEEVVVWFGPAVSGSCSDIRLDDVVLDGAELRPEIVLPGGSRGCTDDANPHAYVVTYERARLPERFTISVAPNDTCCPEATTAVDLGSYD